MKFWMCIFLALISFQKVNAATYKCEPDPSMSGFLVVPHGEFQYFNHTGMERLANQTAIEYLSFSESNSSEITTNTLGGISLDECLGSPAYKSDIEGNCFQKFKLQQISENKFLYLAFKGLWGDSFTTDVLHLTVSTQIVGEVAIDRVSYSSHGYPNHKQIYNEVERVICRQQKD